MCCVISWSAMDAAPPLELIPGHRGIESRYRVIDGRGIESSALTARLTIEPLFLSQQRKGIDAVQQIAPAP